MVLIYTKRPHKAVEFLIKIYNKYKEEGIPVKFLRTAGGYQTKMQVRDEMWIIIPISNDPRGYRWRKCYVDLDITERELKDIVLPKKDIDLTEGWERPMIFI